MEIGPGQLDSIVKAALQEDLGPGDVTTESIVPPSAVAVGEIRAKERGVLCGLRPAEAVFRALDPAVEITCDLEDGESLEPGVRVLRLRGKARSLLAGERTALNFLQRLSGIATLTRSYCDALEGTGVKIFDTRKTTPLWRPLEKHAVRCGGGENHRMGLHDQAMLKENHLTFIPPTEEAWREAVLEARGPGRIVVVEARTEAEACRAVRAGADGVLLDNFPVEELPAVIAAVRKVRGKEPFVEVSGGVTLESVAQIARAGPDRISVGAITHSAPALDLSMRTGPAETP